MEQTIAQAATAPNAAPAPFQVSDSAAARITKITSDEPAGTRFRITIKGGGCSGFQYLFDLDSKPAGQEDIVIGKNGAGVIIDEMSMGMLAGSMLDYVETLGSAGFEIRNPNATARCGCGNSFSV